MIIRRVEALCVLYQHCLRTINHRSLQGLGTLPLVRNPQGANPGVDDLAVGVVNIQHIA